MSEGFDWAEAIKAGQAEEEAKRQRYEARVNALPGDPVERWLSQYPSGPRPQLLGRIEKPRGKHEGATFELMLHALLEAQGFNVTVNSGTPDFDVVSHDGTEFSIEATSVIVDEYDLRLSNAATALQACLRSVDIEHDGMVVRAVLERFKGTVPCRQIKEKVKEAVEQKETKRFANRRWAVQIEVDICEPGKFCDDKSINVTWVSSGATPDVYLRRKLGDKIGVARADVPGNVPHVVAINIQDEWWGDAEFDDWSVLSAFMAGSPQVTWQVNHRTGETTDPEIGYPFDAAVVRDGKRPVHQRVSGLWAFSNISWLPHRRRSKSALRFPRYACYYPNPWARKPLENPFPEMRRCHLRAGEDVAWIDGKSIGEVLRLPYDWPRGEQG